MGVVKFAKLGILLQNKSVSRNGQGKFEFLSEIHSLAI